LVAAEADENDVATGDKCSVGNGGNKCDTGDKGPTWV